MFHSPQHAELTNETLKRYRIDLRKEVGPEGYLLQLNLDTAAHITVPETNVDYYFRQVDYLDRAQRVRGSRMFAELLAGKRTDSAYWTPAAPATQLTIHRGAAEVVVADLNSQITHAVRLCTAADERRSVELAPDRCYTVRALPDTDTMTVVSGWYEGQLDWETAEQAIPTGAQSFTTHAGVRELPLAFRQALAGQALLG